MINDSRFIREFERIEVLFDGSVCTVRLLPVERGHIFDGALLEDLTELVKLLPTVPELRVVVLRGTGSVFCAGGDPEWLEDMRQASVPENVAISLQLEKVYSGLHLLAAP